MGNYIYLRHLEYASATYRVAVRKPPRLHHVVVTVLVAFAFSVHIYPPSNEHDYSVNHFDSKHTIIYRLLKTLLKSSLEFGAHFFIQNATHSTTPLNHPSTSNLRSATLTVWLSRLSRVCRRRMGRISKSFENEKFSVVRKGYEWMRMKASCRIV